MSERFIQLEDEIQLRIAIKLAFKHEGWPGILQMMGELSQSLEIVGQVAQELIEEEAKKDKGDNV